MYPFSQVKTSWTMLAIKGGFFMKKLIALLCCLSLAFSMPVAEAENATDFHTEAAISVSDSGEASPAATSKELWYVECKCQEKM